MIAGIAKASRLGNLATEAAAKARDNFESEWPDILQVPTDEPLVRSAAALAWDLHLRGYDAVQLASAITLQELLGEPVGFVTFDRQLWLAAKQADVTALPDDLPTLLDS